MEIDHALERPIGTLRHAPMPEGFGERWGFSRAVKKSVLIASVAVAAATSLGSQLNAVEREMSGPAPVAVEQSVERTPEDALANALQAGRSSYGEMSKAFYGDKAAAIFEQKRAYQAAHQNELWLSTYKDDALNREIPMEVWPSDHHAFKRGSDGGYLAAIDTIFLRERETIPLSDVIHELGHAMQKGRSQDVSAQGLALIQAKRPNYEQANILRYGNLGKGIKVPMAPASHPFINYLVSRIELEPRLQSMNRYFFAKTGRAIETNEDARECLRLAETETDERLISHHRETMELPRVFKLATETDGKKFSDRLIEEIVLLAPGHASVNPPGGSVAGAA